MVIGAGGRVNLMGRGAIDNLKLPFESRSHGESNGMR